jgi:hypothetical protein
MVNQVFPGYNKWEPHRDVNTEGKTVTLQDETGQYKDITYSWPAPCWPVLLHEGEEVIKWPNKAPTLSCTFTNEFGDTHTVSASLMNSTLFEVYENMRLACLGFGFSEENVKEIFGESC